MIRDVLCSLDYSICAEISLLIFATVFVLISVRTIVGDRSNFNSLAEIPLHDGWEKKSDA